MFYPCLYSVQYNKTSNQTSPKSIYQTQYRDSKHWYFIIAKEHKLFTSTQCYLIYFFWTVGEENVKKQQKNERLRILLEFQKTSYHSRSSSRMNRYIKLLQSYIFFHKRNQIRDYYYFLYVSPVLLSLSSIFKGITICHTMCIKWLKVQSFIWFSKLKPRFQ
jgi:hypothetical protein